MGAKCGPWALLGIQGIWEPETGPEALALPHRWP